jgi:uncharacterized membrane protein YadS
LVPETRPRENLLKLIPGMILGAIMLPLGYWLSGVFGIPHWTGSLLGVGVIVCGAAAYNEISMRIAFHRRGR